VSAGRSCTVCVLFCAGLHGHDKQNRVADPGSRREPGLTIGPEQPSGETDGVGGATVRRPPPARSRSAETLPSPGFKSRGSSREARGLTGVTSGMYLHDRRPPGTNPNGLRNLHPKLSARAYATPKGTRGRHPLAPTPKQRIGTWFDGVGLAELEA